MNYKVENTWFSINTYFQSLDIVFFGMFCNICTLRIKRSYDEVNYIEILLCV